MSTVSQTIRELEIRRNRANKEVEKLGLAIKALEQLDGEVTGAAQARPKRRMSAAARRKIAAAMKAHWAKVKK